jgi:Rieske Fe-S protein
MHLQELPNASDSGPEFGGHGSHETEPEHSWPLERFSHLVLGVTDLDRSEAFYGGVLEIDVLGRNLTAEERPHLVLRMNTGQLMILVQHDKLHMASAGTGVHHGFMVTPNQYRHLYEHLKELGYDIEDSREVFRAHGEYSIDVQDPDGHRFQIQTYGPEAREIMPGAGVVDCGPAERYRINDVKAFKVGNFHLVRNQDGFLAISKWCTHMNGIVVFQKAHWHFACPFHDATYDLCGVPAPFRGNRADGPLRLHPITFNEDGHVLVNTDDVIERSGYHADQAARPAVGARAAG